MKKIRTALAAVAAMMLLAGCGTTGSALMSGMGVGTTPNATPSSTTTTAPAVAETPAAQGGLASLLGNVLGAVLGASNQLTEADLVGVWNYQSVDCVFETENLLMKAGGEVASNQIETKLNETFSKFGVVPGACSFTFNSDKTYTATIAGYAISGQYALDAENKKLTMTYLAGLASMNPHIVKTGNKISLLYDADKLLTVAQKLAAMSNNSTMQTLSSLASSYDGMMVGIELQK